MGDTCLRQEDHKFWASLNIIAKLSKTTIILYLKKRKKEVFFLKYLSLIYYALLWMKY